MRRKHQPTITECIEWYIRRYYWVDKPWENMIPRSKLWAKIELEGWTHGQHYETVAHKLNCLFRDLTTGDIQARYPKDITISDAIAALQLIRETHRV